MQTNLTGLQLPELTQEISREQSVCFDPESVRLEGTYRDELSVYRARKVWKETFLNYFLLEADYDFKLHVRSDVPTGRYILNCEFTSACARYCFWRLTNDQTPEAQYLIETAHIPQSDSHRDDFLYAPDLRPAGHEDPLIMQRINELSEAISLSPVQKLVDLLRRVCPSKK